MVIKRGSNQRTLALQMCYLNAVKLHNPNWRQLNSDIYATVSVLWFNVCALADLPTNSNVLQG